MRTIDPKLLFFKIQNEQKNDQPTFGQSEAMCLTRMAHPWALNTQDCIFYPLGILIFLQENVIKSQNLFNLGRLADKPICPKWSALWGPKYMIWQFF